ncbi:MAG: hypothetical protein HYV07_01740 [Deltaproteobacteria bacterium]|nr:hypothetical protein [Deltaproteobacteria bacterium]
MPSSRPDHIPLILDLVRQLRPSSILDIGTGFGKWGMLFREYSDIILSENHPVRYRREGWRVRIDGVEGFEAYLTPVHRYVYDEVFVGDMRKVVPELGRYDLIFLGDVIEHVDKRDGLRLLADCLGRANQAVIVSTPARETHQAAVCHNALEIHRSLWGGSDFAKLGRPILETVDPDILVAVLLKDGVPRPSLPGRARRMRRRLRPLKSALGRLGLWPTG